MEYTILKPSLSEGILLITISRPAALNALNTRFFLEFNELLNEHDGNKEVKVVVITGEGKAFVAGADIAEMVNMNPEEGSRFSRTGQLLFDRIEKLPFPVIAAVNGFALGGGCELAMACDFRIAGKNAKFGQPEVNLGLIPGYGGTQRLTQLIGKGKSMELQMTAQIIDANEAYRLGLVNHVTTSDSLLEKTKEILQTIQTKAPIAIGKIIECINVAVLSDSAYTNGKTGYEKEIESFGECFDTADMKEGTSAFLEKRKPNFKGE